MNKFEATGISGRVNLISTLCAGSVVKVRVATAEKFPLNSQLFPANMPIRFAVGSARLVNFHETNASL